MEDKYIRFFKFIDILKFYFFYLINPNVHAQCMIYPEIRTLFKYVIIMLEKAVFNLFYHFAANVFN